MWPLFGPTLIIARQKEGRNADQHQGAWLTERNSTMRSKLPFGIYDAVIDNHLQDVVPFTYLGPAVC